MIIIRSSSNLFWVMYENVATNKIKKEKILDSQTKLISNLWVLMTIVINTDAQIKIFQNFLDFDLLGAQNY